MATAPACAAATPPSFRRILRADDCPPPALPALCALAVRAKLSAALRCRCTAGDSLASVNGADKGPVGSDSFSDWSWSRWNRHFAQLEQAEKYVASLQSQLREAIENENFSEAAKLKKAIVQITSKDPVAQVMSELEEAIKEQRFHDASRLSKLAGAGMVGWWVGFAKDTDETFWNIVRITPELGRYVARSYNPRQLLTKSPGTPAFEIFLLKDDHGMYMMKAVYLQEIKVPIEMPPSSSVRVNEASPAEGNDRSSMENNVADEDPEGSSSDFTAKEDENGNKKTDGSISMTDRVEGLNSVLNFFKKRLPEFNVQIIDTEVSGDSKLAAESFEQSKQENSSDSTPEISESESDVQEGQKEALPTGGGVDPNEESANKGMKVFISGVVHNKDDISSKSCLRVPAIVKDVDKDSFVFCITGKRSDVGPHGAKATETRSLDLAVQSASQLMPSDVAEVFCHTGSKGELKASEDIQEAAKMAVSHTHKRFRFSNTTTFNRINTDVNGLDPLNGLYVGSVSPYGPEIIQLSRKYGHWNGPGEIHSDIEFFEYVEAVKLTGDFSIPAGQVTFRAKIGNGSWSLNRAYSEDFGAIASYKGQVKMADPGFKNPRWVDGELLVLSGKSTIPHVSGSQLGFLFNVGTKSFLVLFYRLKLPE